MKKKLLLIGLSVVTIFTLIGCNKKNQIETEEEQLNNKLQVMASIEPVRAFAEIIGGDKVDVRSMVPNGVEPHDFEPKTKDLVELNKSKVFFYNGLGMEGWLPKVQETIKNNDTLIVNTSEGVDILTTDGKQDPHTWLSLKAAEKQAENIKNTFIKVDEQNKEYYEANYNEFSKELNDLYNEYNNKFKEASNKDFVTGHAAFGYLCRDFSLNQKSVEDVLGEGEITPQRLKELTEFCRENNIKTIFMPDLVSPKISETLANEVGGKVEKIYSLESKEDDLGYIESMRANLEKIYISLK